MTHNRLPLDSSESIVFRPEALLEIAPEIGFHLGSPSRRARRAFDVLITAEGLVLHREDDFREEMIRAVKSLSLKDDECETHIETLKRFWDALDQYNAGLREHVSEQNILPEDERTPFPDFEDDDSEMAQMIMDEVEPRWPPIARMAAQNKMFGSEQPRLCLSCVLESVEGIDIPISKVDFFKGTKRIAMDSIDALEEAMVDRFGEAVGMTAFTTLLVEAMSRMFLSRSAEKNLPSPPPSTPIPQDMTKDGAENPSTSPALEVSANPPEN